MADALDLGSSVQKTYEFKSHRPHHSKVCVCGNSSVVEHCLAKAGVASSNLVLRSICGCNSMVEFQPSKLATWVRFPSPAPTAVVAQLVERHLAKVEVASPSLVYRSICAISSVGRAPDS